MKCQKSTRLRSVLVRGGFGKEGLWDHPESDQQTGDHRAHEHDRTRSRFCPKGAGIDGAVGVGLETLQSLWRHMDVQVRGTIPPSLDFGGSEEGAHPVAQVLRVQEDIQRGARVVGSGELVCAGCASLRDRQMGA